MPDISMCSNKDCSMRKDCYRHEESGTKPSYWQSVMHFAPKEDGKCDDFLEKRK